MSSSGAVLVVSPPATEDAPNARSGRAQQAAPLWLSHCDIEAFHSFIRRGGAKGDGVVRITPPPRSAASIERLSPRACPKTLPPHPSYCPRRDSIAPPRAQPPAQHPSQAASRSARCSCSNTPRPPPPH